MRYLPLIALLSACGTSVPTEHQMAFDRAIEETRRSLKYPDTAEYPGIEEADISTDKSGNVHVIFSVKASNAAGVKTSESTSLHLRVDSCAHVLSGMVASEMVDADPSDRPCNKAALSQWEADRAVQNAMKVIGDVESGAQVTKLSTAKRLSAAKSPAR